jgi:hypothetical protein
LSYSLSHGFSIALTPTQRSLLDQIYTFISNEQPDYVVPDDIRAQDRAFVQRLARELALEYTKDAKGVRKFVSLRKRDGEDPDIVGRRQEVLQEYIQRLVIDPATVDVAKLEAEKVNEEFMAMRKGYYRVRLISLSVSI